MVDLDTLLQSFLLKWILRYFSHAHSKWSKIIDNFFCKLGGVQYVLNSNCKKDEIMIFVENVNMPQYYLKKLYMLGSVLKK